MVKYHSEPFNQVNGGVQRIRITDGCPHQCEWCYCPPEIQIYPVPEIMGEKVQILDMNFLARPDCRDVIHQIGKLTKEIELVCGVDYRLLTKEIAIDLKESGVKKIHFAWDGKPNLQCKMKDTWTCLKHAGFTDISVFILANWKVSLQDCLFKLDLLKIWNCKACDCYFDGQVSPNIYPIYWKRHEIQYFRKKCRKHNQMVLFKIDPQPGFKIPPKINDNNSKQLALF